MFTMTDAPDDEDLVRQALDGLFEIACEDRPGSVTASLRDQIDELPEDECRRLVEQMVDADRLEHLLEHGIDADNPRPPSPQDERAEKVDRALEPLVRWRLGEEGRRQLAGVPDDERMHLLFSSLGGR